MNRKERRSKKKKPVTKSLKGAKMVTEETENTFKAWLEYSQLTEEYFLSLSEVRPFEILKQMISEIEVISIGNLKEGSFEVIGEPFVSQSKIENKNFEIDMALMLFYMATKLDNQYVNNPKFPERNGCDYFYNQVKNFLKTENIKF